MSLFGGLLFGLTLQIAIGPVFFAVLHKSVKEGFAEALKMVAGVALTDAFYITVSFTGIGSLLKLQFLHRFIYLAGAGILIFFGACYFRNAKKSSAVEDGSCGKDAENKGVRSFFYGIKLTLVNPLTIVFWSGMFGTLIASGELAGLQNIILYSLGCVMATVLFLGAVSWAGKHLLRFLNGGKLKYLDYAVGVFLMIFGLRMLFL